MAPKCANIPGLKRKPKRDDWFDDLTKAQRERAKRYLDQMIRKRQRRGKRVTRWVYPLLVGQAKRLARNPPTSAWGRSMAAKKGGYAVQQRYRMEGRDPTAKASYIRQIKQGKPAKHRPLLKPGFGPPVNPVPYRQPPPPVQVSKLAAGGGLPPAIRNLYEQRQKYFELTGEYPD